MTVHVSIEEAVAQLPKLIEQALCGEEVVINLYIDGTEQVRAEIQTGLEASERGDTLLKRSLIM